MSGTTQSFVRALVPFSFKRGQCFLCDARAVTHVAGEPVCAHHEQVIEQIRREAEERAA